VRFYLVAMIFVIFASRSSSSIRSPSSSRSSARVVEIGLFSVVVFAALLFLVAEGALSWARQGLTKAMPSRTSDSTIARITPRPTDRAA